MVNGKLRATSSWIEEAKREKEIEEDLLACRLIVLKIVRYMKDNHLSQKELAKKLNVSPQYINKFLHGQDMDMKVSTVFRYGRILGIKLLDLPVQDYNEEMRSSFGFATMKRTSAQTACFDYVDNLYLTPCFMPHYSEGDHSIGHFGFMINNDGRHEGNKVHTKRGVC